MPRYTRVTDRQLTECFVHTAAADVATHPSRPTLKSQTPASVPCRWLRLVFLSWLVAAWATLTGCSAPSVEPSAERTASQHEALTSVHQNASGNGSSVETFSADKFFEGGGTYTTGAAVSIAGVANAAPAAVY